jgi:hypothetical protein
MEREVRPFLLKLGKDYEIGYNNKKRLFRLIKTTPKGYKFLNLETSKCNKRLLYPSKAPNHIGKKETWFWLSVNFPIKEVINEH